MMSGANQGAVAGVSSMMNCFVATNQDRNFLKAVSFKAILLLACLVAVSPSYAQLTFGGSEPVEEEVEEQI